MFSNGLATLWGMIQGSEQLEQVLTGAVVRKRNLENNPGRFTLAASNTGDDLVIAPGKIQLLTAGGQLTVAFNKSLEISF